MSEKKVITNPVKAIRKYCLDCASTAFEVKKCPIDGCHLYPFRFGTNPFRTRRELTEEQKAAMAERLRKGRETKLAEKSQ